MTDPMTWIPPVRRWWRAVVAAVLLTVVAAPASAQYFGRNKVRYRDFHFEVLKTRHFDVYFYPEEAVAAREAARMAERWYARYARVLDHQLNGPQPLILYADHTDFEQTNAIQGELGAGTGGVTEIVKRRIVLPLAGTLAEDNHVIGHELVHAFQFDITSQGSSAVTGSVPGAARLPLWFIEGMAEYMSLGPVDPNTAMWMRDAVRENTLPDIKDLNDPKYFPYRWGQAFWAYVTGRWGDPVIGTLLRAAGSMGSATDALQHVLKESPAQLSKDWHAALRQEYEPVVKATDRPSAYGRTLMTGTSEADQLNVSPALSPDGTKVLFLSARGLFSIDLYLADAKTGKIIRRVTRTALDPHFSSLEFINSAGAWAPDNRRFVFSAVSAGRPELVILDVGRDRVEREIRLPSLGEIFSPSWAPDGHAIVFSAMVGGLTDLFTYDLQTGTLQRLTDDPYADLQPAWSPDGKTIAFVTDRYSTHLNDLQPGRYQLALYDLASGQISPLGTFPQGKSINPQWAGDGRALFFISDRNGISNVYRLDIASGAVTQVTNLNGGVSGITALSPALSVASQTGALAFSVYDKGANLIYLADRAAVLAGGPLQSVPGVADPAALPPPVRLRGTQTLMRGEPSFGLPALSSLPEKPSPYRPTLSLDHIGQPYLAVGANPFGTFVGGGLALFWSDMLGDRTLATAVQVGSSFSTGFADSLKNTSALVSYQDQTHRWSWGGAVQQYPYVTGAFQTGVSTVNGALVGVQQTTLFRQINRGVTAVTAYPLDPVRRVEFSTGYQNSTFDQIVQTRVFDPVSGQVLGSQTQDQPLAGSLNLGSVSAALVSDNSYFGATSPILGQRYRLQVTPTAGSLAYSSVLADYRRYFMPAQFYTIAARLVHYGRYGSGAEDPRLVPLFIGYPDLVRGYDISSFSPSECHATAADPCPAFDRLLGSRILVGNLELRFPLLRPFGNTDQPYGPVPMEVALFTDGGVAWTSRDGPTFFGGDRAPVGSAGVALRVNVFGYAIAEFDAVRPFDRPGRGWMFEFGFSPGF
ncbi:MAG: PD40 domain-containing protein [Acidobacteriota bacterium]|nr:PD40 domain-containing protein [Acidobacteriota bacterium]